MQVSKGFVESLFEGHCRVRFCKGDGVTSITGFEFTYPIDSNELADMLEKVAKDLKENG